MHPANTVLNTTIQVRYYILDYTVVWHLLIILFIIRLHTSCTSVTASHEQKGTEGKEEGTPVMTKETER